METRGLRKALSQVFGLLLVAGLAVEPAKAQQTEVITVDPIYSLELRFTVPHPLALINCCGGSVLTPYPPDMMHFNLSGIQIDSSVGSHSATLFDGETQLGVVTNSLEGISFLEMGNFQTAASAFYAGPARQTVIDFSSITDGTIDGRLLFTISQGSFGIDEESVIRGLIGYGWGGAVLSNGDDATFTSVKLIALDPVLALEDLQAEVAGVGPGKKLIRIVELAQTYNDAGDTGATCAVLADFIYQVDRFASLPKPKLTSTQAVRLTSHAEAILRGLGCN